MRGGKLVGTVDRDHLSISCLASTLMLLLSVCLSSLVCVVGLFLCTLMWFFGFMGVLFYA